MEADDGSCAMADVERGRGSEGGGGGFLVRESEGGVSDARGNEKEGAFDGGE